MAVKDVKEVSAQIKKSEFQNLYYFYGRNVSGVENLTRLLIKNTVGGMEEFALTKINGKEINIPALRDTMEMLPMMCEYNCILINDYNCDEIREDTTKQLIEALKEIPSQTIIVFNVTGFDVKDGKKVPTAKNKKLIDFVSKNGIVCEQELKTPAELAKSVLASVQKRGCEISIGTAQQLAEMCLSNPLMISNEIDKLCAYANGSTITNEMLELMVAQQTDTTVYSLANAIVYLLLIMGFTYFYTYATFNPAEVSNNIKKNGGFIPGIRAGKPTTDYLSSILTKITVFGGLFLAVIAILPMLLSFTGLNISFGGTSILIVVGVALETVQQLESQLVMRHYKGFLE